MEWLSKIHSLAIGCVVPSCKSDFFLFLTLLKLTCLKDLNLLNNPDNCDCLVLIITLLIFTLSKIAASGDLFRLFKAVWNSTSLDS